MRKKKEINYIIGDRIRIAREKCGLTQEKLAEDLDLSTQFISKIERGVAGASLETIVRICDTLDVSAEWLLRGKEATPTASTIAAQIGGLSPEQLASISRLISELLTLLQITTAETDAAQDKKTRGKP